MNYDEITKITAELIDSYMTQAVNADSTGVAEMYHNAAWGVRTLWFDLASFTEIAGIMPTVTLRAFQHLPL
ncbi:hypothetical protein, partial [Escherichia coli]|uniref:hypothetical protein n=1 Tax=Escherichia coli TaxID=562 RepID=UPI000907B2D0